MTHFVLAPAAGILGVASVASSIVECKRVSSGLFA
jgi:hypothetical protein